MLTNDQVKQILTLLSSQKDDKIIRLMSCDNPIKNMFVNNLLDLSSKPFDFLERIEDYLVYFSSMTDYILKNERSIDRSKLLGISNQVLLPTRQIVEQALLEIKAFHNCLIYLQSEQYFLHSYYHEIRKLTFFHYSILTTFCGMTDLSKDINYSKLLGRFLNFQKQCEKVYHKNMLPQNYLVEINYHRRYLEEQILLFQSLGLKKDDIFIFMLLFDIKS